MISITKVTEWSACCELTIWQIYNRSLSKTHKSALFECKFVRGILFRIFSPRCETSAYFPAQRTSGGGAASAIGARSEIGWVSPTKIRLFSTLAPLILCKVVIFSISYFLLTFNDSIVTEFTSFTKWGIFYRVNIFLCYSFYFSIKIETASFGNNRRPLNYLKQTLN